MNHNDRRNQPGGRGPSETKYTLSFAKIFEASWIESGITNLAINYCEELGHFLAKVRSHKEEALTTSQFRNFYGELKRIQLKGIDEEKSSFHLLRPKLAYAAARAKTKGAQVFKEEILKAHAAVKIDESGAAKRFANFCDFTEAILAYHKANNGN
jgi:CRISPR-associated protein Csm2